MKKILVIIALLATTHLFAQTEKIVVETSKKSTNVKLKKTKNVSVQETDGATRIRVGSTEINIADENVHIDFWKPKTAERFIGHWSGFELGVNGYLKDDYTGYDVQDFMEVRLGKSISARFNLMQFDFNLQKEKDNFGFLTGLGFESKDFRFQNSYTIKNVNGRTEPRPLTYKQLKKSKLNILYATVPAIFEIQFPSKRYNTFYIGIGVEGGLRLTSHTKIKYKEDGSWEKAKDHSSFNLNRWKLDAQLRMGYGGINLFFNYGLVDLFKENRGPILTPFTVGITLVSF